MNENIVCFYHEYEENGCFSNWYRCDFKYAKMKFTSMEQYMMYHKVIMFRQYELADRIMETDDPAIIKKIGRTRFNNFNSYLWDKTCCQIVKRGLRAKFEQNEDLLEALLNTKDKLLVECSSRDKKWGIGIDINDPMRFDVELWDGDNLLGRLLMEVREELKIAKANGTLGYIDALDKDFPLWHMKAGELKRIPKFYDAIHAYSDTLIGKHEKNCFLYDCPLTEWELAMRVNMGGGLPAIGFYEMKQDLFDTMRY